MTGVLVHARAGLLARLFARAAGGVRISAGSIELVGRAGSECVPLCQVESVMAQHGRIWGRIVVRSRGGRAITIGGLRWRAARDVAAVAGALLARDELAELAGELARPGGRDDYLTHSAFARWRERAARVAAAVDVPEDHPGLPADLAGGLRAVREALSGGEEARSRRNQRFVEAQARRHEAWFSGGQGYPLTERQREAILHDEDNCLVVAGAGTGKTSTIVGKVGAVVAGGAARPEEVLLLAFTRKARDEMAERLERLLGAEVAVKTFHGLGLEILAEADGRKPSLSALAEDDRRLRSVLGGFLQELLGSGAGAQAREFLAYHRYPYRDASEFPTEHRYIQYLAGHDVRTLRDERVKSVEECLIANWLLLHGVEYEYERPYEHDTASVQHRQYKPDFYLPGYGIYIEHFGVDRQGRPPPFLKDPEGYRQGMAWKRALHREKGTRLIETYSYLKREGTLFSELERSLRAAGVAIQESPPAALDLLRGEEVVSPAALLLASFLSLYKGNCWTMPEVRAAAAASADPQRSGVFLDVFERVLGRYEALLQGSGEIDFNDMIAAAAARVRAGTYVSRFRYVLVDEFQDISRGRARLLRALLDQVPGRRLFCVGDDWQSIYRFAGSDIGLMTRFREHFGYTRRTDLDQTYRFNDRLLEASSRFICKNPEQLKKTLRAPRRSDVPAVVVLSGPPGERGAEAVREELLSEALEGICEQAGGQPADVLIIGRYRHCLPGHRAGLERAFPGLRLRFMTAHAAKGLEADYAVVLDVIAGKYGFPTEMTDDPLMDLVLARPGSHPNAEERRLFYVALTRARHRTYVLTDDLNRSVFIDELEAPEYSGLVIASGAAARTVACPSCAGGRLRRIDGQFGLFWGCSNFPLCEAKARACPWCGAGAFVRGPAGYRCAAERCGKTAELCPNCRTGAVVPKTGPFGPFMACTEWRREGPSCGYTRGLGRRRYR